MRLITSHLGHKYGLVTPGLGWIIWRDESFLSKDLIFELHYLGGTEQSYTLNFSRPGAQVVVQYYNLIHLGFSGYREVMENCLANARILSKSLEATGWYTCLSDIHRPAPSSSTNTHPALTSRIKDAIVPSTSENKPAAAQTDPGTETSASYTSGLPVVSFRFSNAFRSQYPHIKQETVSLLLRARQWIVPNYALPPNESDTEILRVVIRVSMSFDLLDRLVTDIVQVTETLMERDEVDLSVLQEDRKRARVARRRGVRKDSGKEMEGVEGERGEAGEAGEAGEEGREKMRGKVGREMREVRRRMEEGIHRSVC